MFILSFISRNGRWPKCSIDASVSNFLTDKMTENFRKMVIKKPSSINDYELNIPIGCWHYIIFDKELIFDEFVDFTELLSDTAISPYRQNYVTVYNQECLRVKKPKGNGESRKTLLEIISRENFRLSEVITKIGSGLVPRDWFVVGLHSKER